MRAAAELMAFHREAAAATAAGSRSFFFAARFFPDEVRRSAHAVYWFCRHTDDLVDEAPSPQQGRKALEDWEQRLRSGLQGEPAAHPVLAVFLDAVKRHRIPHHYPLELVEGVRMDLEPARYPDFDALRRFCYRVASVVGLMMTHVIGFQGPAAAYAVDLGIAMQLTNILRDVGEDLERNRIYLPEEELERFGYSLLELRSRVRNESFHRLMRFQLARARSYYERARPGIDLLDERGRFAVRVAADVYEAILDRIESSGFDVFRRRAVVPAWRKCWLAARGMALPAARRSVARLAFWRSCVD